MTTETPIISAGLIKATGEKVALIRAAYCDELRALMRSLGGQWDAGGRQWIIRRDLANQHRAEILQLAEAANARRTTKFATRRQDTGSKIFRGLRGFEEGEPGC